MEIVSYTAEDIRRAWTEVFGGPHIPTFPTWSAEALVRTLEKNDHVHDFADADTVTVKEIRDAWSRQIKGMLGRFNQSPDALLQDISQHREPHCPSRRMDTRELR